MTSTGKRLRIFGAAILLIAVQFASVAAEAHVGHVHAPEGHHLQGLGLQVHGPAAGSAHSIASDETAPADRAARAEPATEVEVTVQNAPGAPPSDPGSDACVMGCCGCSGCCAAALVVVSPHLPPKASSPRIGLARVNSIPGVDPRGLRKPPRSLA
ncbi:hypothetical protein [Bradyrhizobium sp.]|uniref:hypothetical protein n=1 Tax=Bradyrhizobium sp. TaxID=376 RepID=UPI0025C67553|nr:hypothetical protein [Bradyrhizobium sp.]